MDSIFKESVAERQKDAFLWEVGRPWAPIPPPQMLQMLHTFIPLTVPSGQRSDQSPATKPSCGEKLRAGLRGESQTSARASRLRWGTDSDLRFPRTPGEGGRARMGSLEPLIIGLSPPLKVTLLPWGCCACPTSKWECYEAKIP